MCVLYGENYRAEPDCDKLKSECDFTFISKVLCILPSKLLIYGKHDKIAETNNEVTIGIDYWTESANPVLRVFLEKRLGQMVAHLSEKYPAVYCVKV